VKAALGLIAKVVEGIRREVEGSQAAARATILHGHLDGTTAWH
jgi:hypothetical protein